ncbi:type VI secretion system tube protein Hcp [Thermomonas sp. HDW16]|uniref:Hcp family type VI secretion system effector n=1 Tax=Thermomonas sp. HDW16 TaxID=2714945 RepID=UPI00140D7475|nr:type VI secretion system tube protein Hcp [Thermomonas sp. HDW16]QIL20891.1 type VI secretion system tube protein Hcp [Thermomonas sp. HDW16]
MATDYFLKLDSIPGESADSKFKGEIDIQGFSLGAQNSGSMAHGGGGGAGRVEYLNVSISKRVDKASPKLLELVSNGKHIAKAELFCRKQGGEQMVFYTVTLTDVLVTSVSQNGASHDHLLETITFDFGKFEEKYTAQDAKGNKAGDVAMAWNIKENK